MSISDAPEKKVGTSTSQHPREITHPLPSKQTEISSSDLLTPPRKKARTNMSQQPRDSSFLPSMEQGLLLFGVYMTPGKKSRHSSFLPSKEQGLLLFGVYMTPGKKSQQEPRDSFLDSKETEKEDENPYGVSTELTLSIADPWIIKKKLRNVDTRTHLYLRTDLAELHILRHISQLQRGDMLTVNVYDTNTDTRHKVVLMRSKERQTDYYCLRTSWLKNFVYRRNLKIGDEIGLYWDRYHSELHFSLLSRGITDEKKK